MDDDEEEEDEGSGAEERFPFERLKVSPPFRPMTRMMMPWKSPCCSVPPQTVSDEHRHVLVGSWSVITNAPNKSNKYAFVCHGLYTGFFPRVFPYEWSVFLFEARTGMFFLKIKKNHGCRSHNPHSVSPSILS